MELREAGLISYWEKQFDPNTKPCFSGNRNLKNNKEKNKKPLLRLSLANLTGAFALLAFGWLISLFVFLIEKVISVWKANQIIVVYLSLFDYSTFLLGPSHHVARWSHRVTRFEIISQLNVLNATCLLSIGGSLLFKHNYIKQLMTRHLFL